MAEKDKLLEALWLATTTGLLKKVQSGEANGTDFANAIKLLKDNGITIDLRVTEGAGALSPEMKELLGTVPDFTDETQ